MTPSHETAELTPEEAAVVAQFREQMASPSNPAAVAVVNESLGMMVDGTKIQYAPGPGREPSPALKGAQRWAARQRRALEAKEAARARAERGREKSLLARVAEFGKKLEGRNVTDTVAYIDGLSQHDKEVALLAEHAGPNRATVLSHFKGQVGAELREQYESELEAHNALFG